MNWSLLSYYFANNLGWLNDVYKVLPNILYAILAIVGGAGTVYSVVLGVNLAKSENDEKRRYALYRLRNTLIGVALLLIIVIVINVALPEILRKAFPKDVFKNRTAYEDSLPGKSNNNQSMITPFLNCFKSFISHF